MSFPIFRWYHSLTLLCSLLAYFLVPALHLADHGWGPYGLGSSCYTCRTHWYYWVCELGGHAGRGL